MGGSQGGTAENTQHDTQSEQRLFEAFVVRQGAADGADERNQKGGNGGGDAPVGEVLALRQPGGIGQGVEIDGDDGGDQQNKGGVADVVADPGFFQSREFELFFHIPLSNQPKIGANSSPRGLFSSSARTSCSARTG